VRLRTLWCSGFVGVAFAALAPAGGAATQAPSGDTCSASGRGSVYTLVITLPSSASEQAGFAFGAPGISVTSIKVVGPTSQTTGSMSTEGLPANTTAAWLLSTPGVPPGASITASLTTSSAVTGSFTVVPADSSHSTYYDPIVCQVVPSSPLPSNKFTVKQHASYVAATGVWQLTVIIPGPGTVSAAELEPTVGTQEPSSKTAKSLVQARRKGLKSGGKVTLLLKPTADGLAKLRVNGSITVKLEVEFAPKGGKSASKPIKLTLRK
jgi:hypothetical protein